MDLENTIENLKKNETHFSIEIQKQFLEDLKALKTSLTEEITAQGENTP